MSRPKPQIKIILHSTLFNLDKLFTSRKEVKAELGLNYDTIKDLIDTGREYHGYTLDEIEVMPET